MRYRRLPNTTVANNAVLCATLTCRMPYVIAAYLSGYSLKNFMHRLIRASPGMWRSFFILYLTR
ncbi:hypothetical protein AXF42_Ash020330 [Apostasia shenzhenica]|uniref:Uncharacterized protein n=1 Tax=Apostasia shenzhenica TaxID=1088818 RepID=A0A2I0B0P4_9ASPA|nr:hypothetical protein AXF42_Ash020330 [Apostasia shenzhenica]